VSETDNEHHTALSRPC